MLGRYAPPASALRLTSREMVETDRFNYRAIDRHPNPWERISAIRSLSSGARWKYAIIAAPYFRFTGRQIPHP
jgi:hypothetical protein